MIAELMMRIALNSDRREIDADPRIPLHLAVREVATAAGSSSVRFAFVRSLKGAAVMGVKTTRLGTIAIKHDAVGQNNLDAYPATHADGRTDRLGGAWLSVPAALALASTLVARSFVPLPAGREAVA